jgi:hypothetical protein
MQNRIAWQYFPKSSSIPGHLMDVVGLFEKRNSKINSEKHHFTSNRVLDILKEDLGKKGFKVETNKKEKGIIKVPVLFGLNGKPEKSFQADGIHEETRTVIEIEAGRGVTNYQFLKDIFQACMMHNVHYLIIAVRKIYRRNRNFDTVLRFLDTLYTSGRLRLPLAGILLIGY